MSNESNKCNSTEHGGGEERQRERIGVLNSTIMIVKDTARMHTAVYSASAGDKGGWSIAK